MLKQKNLIPNFNLTLFAKSYFREKFIWHEKPTGSVDQTNENSEKELKIKNEEKRLKKEHTDAVITLLELQPMNFKVNLRALAEKTLGESSLNVEKYVKKLKASHEKVEKDIDELKKDFPFSENFEALLKPLWSGSLEKSLPKVIVRVAQLRIAEVEYSDLAQKHGKLLDKLEQLQKKFPEIEAKRNEIANQFVKTTKKMKKESPYKLSSAEVMVRGWKSPEGLQKLKELIQEYEKAESKN